MRLGGVGVKMCECVSECTTTAHKFPPDLGLRLSLSPTVSLTQGPPSSSLPVPPQGLCSCLQAWLKRCLRHRPPSPHLPTPRLCHLHTLIARTSTVLLTWRAPSRAGQGPRLPVALQHGPATGWALSEHMLMSEC